MNAGNADLTRLVARMVKHGATQVEAADMVEKSEIVWHIGANDAISETCVHAEEIMLSGARSCRKALDLMARMEPSDHSQDLDLVTALRKYVEDTCEAIKQVDNALERKGSGLATLLFEIPNSLQGEMSWRDLIGRRDVMAHQLLTVDDQKVYREAQRDFGSLHALLTRVYFVPAKTNLEGGQGFGPLLKGSVLKRLSPSEPGRPPTIGQSLVFVCEDERLGFVGFRIGRSPNNKLLIGGPPGNHRISFGKIGSDLREDWQRSTVNVR